MSTKLDVLIAAPDDDIHAVAVRHQLQSMGVRCLIDDLSWCNDDMELSGKLSMDSDSFAWNGYEISSQTSIWWRRNRSLVASPTIMDPSIQAFVVQEKRQGLLGLMHAFSCRFVNDPFKESRANLKSVQLSVAKARGMRVPRTCITNSVDEARKFIVDLENQGHSCIFKGFTPSKYHMAETRKITSDQLDDKKLNLSLAPVIFQEFIPKLADLRVFCAGDQFFAVECKTTHKELVDWRLDPLVEYERTELRDFQLQAMLQKILKGLELETGSFDVRINQDGIPVFLEVNPAGQFLFMEVDAGLPVIDAMANLLIKDLRVPNYIY